LLNEHRSLGARGAPHVFFVLMIFEFSRLRIRAEILNFFAALSP